MFTCSAFHRVTKVSSPSCRGGLVHETNLAGWYCASVVAVHAARGGGGTSLSNHGQLSKQETKHKEQGTKKRKQQQSTKHKAQSIKHKE